MNNEIMINSKGAYNLLYKLEQLTAEQQREAAPLLQYKAPAELSAEIKALRGYVRALEMSMFPRELIG